MRVLIVDDEVKVCQLIRHLVQWEEYGMEIIGVVNDGEKAYDTIVSEKPDVVISDIRMPGMDGITLAQKTKQEIGEVYFVIISGYSEFEYAKQAVKLGVEDYLVKPIRKKELQSVLEKIYIKNQKAKENSSEKELLKTELVEIKEKVKNNFLQDLLFMQGDYFQLMSLTEIREKYGCCLKEDYYRLIVIHFYENSDDMGYDERNFLLNKMCSSLKNRIEGICEESFFIINNTEVIGLLNLQEEKERKFIRQLSKLSADFMGIQEICPNSKCVVVLSSRMNTLQKCRTYLDNIHMVLLERFYRNEQIIVAEIQDNYKLPEKNLVPAEIRKKLLLEIELRNAEGVKEQLLQIQNIAKEHLLVTTELLSIYKNIVSIFLLGVQNYYLDNNKPVASEYFDILERYYSFEQVFSCLVKEMVEYIKTQEQNQKELELRPIRIAKKYINDNIGKNVSLEVVSREVGLNPAYFSTLFKQITEQSFMDYVISVRMEKAKSLLIRSRKEVIDIAYEIGYSDVKYFSKLFKKSTSLSPTEYRKLYQ